MACPVSSLTRDSSMTWSWCWWSFYLSHVIILYQVVSRFIILYYSIILCFSKRLNTIEHRLIDMHQCFPILSQGVPLTKCSSTNRPCVPSPPNETCRRLVVLNLLLFFLEPFDVWIFFNHSSEESRIWPRDILERFVVTGERPCWRSDPGGNCDIGKAPFFVGKMSGDGGPSMLWQFDNVMGFDVTTRWRELGTSWPNVPDGGSLLMHTFSPCVLVSLRTLGVAWLSRKVSAKNDPIDCHEYSCNEGLFLKMQWTTHHFCVTFMSDSSLLSSPKDSKRRSVLPTTRQFRIA